MAKASNTGYPAFKPLESGIHGRNWRLLLPDNYQPAEPLIAMGASDRTRLSDFQGEAPMATGVWPQRGFQPEQMAADERKPVRTEEGYGLALSPKSAGTYSGRGAAVQVRKRDNQRAYMRVVARAARRATLVERIQARRRYWIMVAAAERAERIRMMRDGEWTTTTPAEQVGRWVEFQARGARKRHALKRTRKCTNLIRAVRAQEAAT
jgi:hypothetical protein